MSAIFRVINITGGFETMQEFETRICMEKSIFGALPRAEIPYMTPTAATDVPALVRVYYKYTSASVNLAATVFGYHFDRCWKHTNLSVPPADIP